MSRTEARIMEGWQFTLQEPTDENFKPVHLPHDWAISAPINKEMSQGAAQGFLDRWGIGWYRRTLLVKQLKKDFIYQLEFDGIYENSTIWVNGKEAGGQKYGYSSFTLEITDYLKEGENQLLVKVDNTSEPVCRWYSGAGIYRTVKLLELYKKHLNPGDIQVKTAIQGSTGIVTIYTGMKDHVKAILSDGDTVITGETDQGYLSISIPNVRLWSPEQPHLYSLELSLLEDGNIVDTYSMNIGVREITMVADKGMFLNGKVIKIKGVCIHQEAGCVGIAATPELWRERLLKFKEIGCNAIRAAHHIHATEFLDACDELGFLVYEEAFDKWTGGLYARYFQSEWKKDLECMVKRDRNHPCIFIWGVGNEVEHQGQESMLRILKMMKEHLLKLDDTRPVSYAMNPHFKRESGIDASKVKDIQEFVDVADEMEIDDLDERIERIRRIAEIVDVISCNYQEQWYPAIHRAIPDKLILGTETYQYFKGHPDQLQNFSDENPWMDVEMNDYVIGGMLWTGIDYLGESMGYPAKGWAGSLFWTNQERKPISYLFESYWSKKPMVYFAVMDYSLPDELVKEHWDAPRYASHWDFPQLKKSVVPYMIASNCEEVKLYINDKQIFVKPPSQYQNRMITGFLPYLPGTVTVKGYNAGSEVCSHIVKTSGAAVRLKFDEEEIQMEAKEGYLKLFTVRAVDKDGIPVIREGTKVIFRVSGPAEIVGVDNGDMCSHETFASNCMHLYRGCVSTVLRLTGEKGRVVIEAQAEGMYEGRMIIHAIVN